MIALRERYLSDGTGIYVYIKKKKINKKKGPFNRSLSPATLKQSIWQIKNGGLVGGGDLFFTLGNLSLLIIFLFLYVFIVTFFVGHYCFKLAQTLYVYVYIFLFLFSFALSLFLSFSLSLSLSLSPFLSFSLSHFLSRCIFIYAVVSLY